MNNHRKIDFKLNLNMLKILIVIVFLSSYILPNNFLESMNLPLDKILFAGILLSYYAYEIYTNKKVKFKDIIILLIILYFSLVLRNFSSINLMGMIVIDKIIDKENEIIEYLNKSKIIVISLIFTIIYSIIYFGYEGRYLYTGLREINQSGYAILFLFLMIRNRYKKIGNALIVLGFLTFSRNYLIGVIILIIFEEFGLKNLFSRSFTNKTLGNFKFMSICIIIILIFLSKYFTYLHNNDLLNSYVTGFSRYFNVKDYSNYFRFTTNTNLFQIYKHYPVKLLEGLSTEEFLLYNREITIMNAQRYRAIKPHNYFFSYFRIYGIFCLPVFWYISTVFKKVISKDNVFVFLIIMCYISFLGIGLANYYLYISIFTLLLYKDKNVEESYF